MPFILFEGQGAWLFEVGVNMMLNINSGSLFILFMPVAIHL